MTDLERRLAVAAAVCDALAGYVERRTGEPAEDWRLRAPLYRAAAEQLERSRRTLVAMIGHEAWRAACAARSEQPIDRWPGRAPTPRPRKPARKGKVE